MKALKNKSGSFIYGAYVFGIVLLLGIGYLFYRTIKKSEDNLRWVLHTHEVLNEGERLLSDTKEAHIAQRGYLLTADTVYLAMHADSKDKVLVHLSNLKSLTADQPIQQKRLQELTALVSETFAFWSETIALNQAGEHEKAIALVRTGVGRDLATIRIGRLMSEFEQLEQLLLSKRRADYISSRSYGRLLEVGGGVLAILLLSFAFVLLRRLLERERQLSATLEERVERRTEELSKSLQDLTAANESVQRTNERLAAANQQLSHINSDLDNFIYTASHDLRAPISNIERLVEELLLELPEESLHESGVKSIAAMMQGAVERFKRTIASLTEISKLQKDNGEESTQVNLAEIVEEVRLDMEQIIKKSGVRVETDFEGCSVVSFSEKNVRSIVYNLLSNAVKFRHPDRHALVQVSCREEAESVVLSVRDNGLGLTPAQHGKLFTMFKRFHDHVEGSGVGLYMVKRIVDSAGGRIDVKSEEGEGTVFHIYFRKNTHAAELNSVVIEG
ncbi:CHASE3 domain-containing protein [Pontibacter toksunensis]|uniref:histidine kinase n=1 Tax=Pontibacter toksunensis TaxID=1332631 RepID=A0ABW6BYV3_9BACT